ncbi:unnamed protein product [Moneuplotes crassus]|uniref:Uncharacterized protein n=1 Tax=Euplotes crassus TaxID=5936 RepID=A0AAD1XFQ5_EUPCR|nr:unnamed protein product [Moneuplotes crassus]
MMKKSKDLEDSKTSWKMQVLKPFKVHIHRAGSNCLICSKEKKKKLISRPHSQNKRYNNSIVNQNWSKNHQKSTEKKAQTKLCSHPDVSITSIEESSTSCLDFPPVVTYKTLNKRDSSAHSSQLKNFMKKVSLMNKIYKDPKEENQSEDTYGKEAKDLEIETSLGLDFTHETNIIDKSALKPPVYPSRTKTPKIQLNDRGHTKNAQSAQQQKGLYRKIRDDLKNTRPQTRIFRTSVKKINFTFSLLPPGMKKSHKKKLTEASITSKAVRKFEKQKLSVPNTKSISVFKTIIGSPFTLKCEKCSRPLKKNQYRRCCIKTQVKHWKRMNK